MRAGGRLRGPVSSAPAGTLNASRASRRVPTTKEPQQGLLQWKDGFAGLLRKSC